MTRNDILSKWDNNEHGIITGPGKFEGEMIYAPYFYELWLDGCSDYSYTKDGTEIDVFQITEEDVREFPELKGHTKAEVFEDNSGFFYCYIYCDCTCSEEDILLCEACSK